MCPIQHGTRDGTVRTAPEVTIDTETGARTGGTRLQSSRFPSDYDAIIAHKREEGEGRQRRTAESPVAKSENQLASLFNYWKGALFKKLSIRSLILLAFPLNANRCGFEK